MSSILKDMENCSINHLTIMHVGKPKPEDIIIDLRHPSARNQDKLNKLGNLLLSIPFFSLQSSLCKLNINKRYLLYCDNGMMSHLQALEMHNHGFKSVALLNLNHSK
ncbi:MAG: hypothetical protein P8I13_04645 [Porticoccaceae bacterium]|nr:hypothetical protein [Porticoccaceae bacterium]